MDSGPSSPSSGSLAKEIYVAGLFDCIRAIRKTEEEANTPFGKGDPVLAARLRELRSYKEVLMKHVAPQRPKVTITEKKGAEASYESEILYPTTALFYEGLELSLTKGGLFVKTEQLLPIDTVLDATVVLEDENIRFRVLAKVVWLNPRESQGRPAGMGLKFPQLSNTQRQLLLDFLAGEVPAMALAHLAD